MRQSEQSFTKKLLARGMAVLVMLAVLIGVFPVAQMQAEAAQVTDLQVNIPGGYYDSAITLTLTSATPGAVIYYIEDDTTEFSRAYWDLYTGPIAIDTNKTIRAIAMAPGCEDSGIVRNTYTIAAAAKGYVYWNVQLGSNVPIAVLTTNQTGLKYAVTTTAEWTQIDNGDRLDVTVKMNDASATVSAQERALIEANLNGATLGKYYNFEVYKQVQYATNMKLAKINMPLTFIMVVPPDLYMAGTSVTRVYSLMYVEDGVVKTEPVFRTAQGFLNFNVPVPTNYALVYQDIVNE